MSNMQAPRTIYVAPDGTRLAGPPRQAPVYVRGTTYPAPPAATQPMPVNEGGFPAPPQTTVPFSYIPPSSSTASSGQMNVGLLVWGAVLVVFGLLLILAPIFGTGSFHGLVIALFAAAGIALLALAYSTSKKTTKPPAPAEAD